jgi:hypothetical protein
MNPDFPATRRPYGHFFACRYPAASASATSRDFFVNRQHGPTLAETLPLDHVLPLSSGIQAQGILGTDQLDLSSG